MGRSILGIEEQIKFDGKQLDNKQNGGYRKEDSLFKNVIGLVT